MSKTKHSKRALKGEAEEGTPRAAGAMDETTKAADHATPNEDPKKSTSDRKDKKRKRRADEGEEGAAAPEKSNKKRKSKSDKKSRAEEKLSKQKVASTPISEQEEDTSMAQDFVPFDNKPMPDASTANGNDSKKSKKDKKKSKSKSGNKTTKTEETKHSLPEKITPKTEEPPVEEQEAEASEDASGTKKDRFIVFVGNLPFTATKEEVEAHFSKVQPTAIRIMTEKGTSKPRGFAFLEFERYDLMETCLDKFQHSHFPDPKNKKLGYRKINIELTAGGGGNTDDRKEKIRARNDKLDEEREKKREKRSETERKQRDRKEKKERMAKGKGKGEPAKTDAEPVGGDLQVPNDSGIHPSRLAQMQQGPLPEFKHTRKRFGTYY
ncbi:hypothetical protein EJ04DRAFT_571442 [Polyplosphaeria fusca]|uniref:RRM domain-containing protein n=1 Tax=Polyplosphaeria fusca TaxID=682080 RepID=A0A9P4RDE1_9PLEO|nr:hypothetical protein EJ04DRAFT_571442 [Polyplosphaeria fusca]